MLHCLSTISPTNPHHVAGSTLLLVENKYHDYLIYDDSSGSISIQFYFSDEVRITLLNEVSSKEKVNEL
jgi:hypothetical protein